MGNFFKDAANVLTMGGAGAVSSLFKDGKQTPEVAVVADPYGETRNKFLDWLNKQIGQPGATYSGQQVAPLTSQENKSLTTLDAYANRQTPSTFTAAKKQVEDTLGGSFDPTKSPYYQAVKAEAQNNLASTQADIADNAAGKGAFWTGARVSEQADAAKEMNLALNTMMGQLAEQERNRQIQVLPYATDMANTEDNQALKTVAALQEYGALPRENQNAINEAAYNEWLRSNVEWPMNIAQLAGNTQQAPLYGQVGYTPSIFKQLLGTFGSAAAGAAGKNLGASLFKS